MMPVPVVLLRRLRRFGGPAIVFDVMSPTWIWMQVAIVLLVLVGIVIAITRLA